MRKHCVVEASRRAPEGFPEVIPEAFSSSLNFHSQKVGIPEVVFLFVASQSMNKNNK